MHCRFSRPLSPATHPGNAGRQKPARGSPTTPHWGCMRFSTAASPFLARLESGELPVSYPTLVQHPCHKQLVDVGAHGRYSKSHLRHRRAVNPVAARAFTPNCLRVSEVLPPCRVAVAYPGSLSSRPTRRPGRGSRGRRGLALYPGSDEGSPLCRIPRSARPPLTVPPPDWLLRAECRARRRRRRQPAPGRRRLATREMDGWRW